MRRHLSQILWTVVLVAMTAFTSAASAQTPAESAAAAASSADLAKTSAAASEKSAKAAAESASAAAGARWTAPGSLMLNSIPIVVFLGSLLGVLLVRKALAPTNWSFADALSEEVSLPYFVETKDANGVKTREAKLDSDNKPVLIPEMRASSSRVIAMMGMIALLFMFIGFGTFALFSFGNNGSLPAGIDGVVTFLLSGMTLFAPYALNKFSSVFQGLSSNK
jgi:hypothetical protein